MFEQFPRKTSSLIALVAFAVQILVFAPSVSAKWHDRSDELDGGGDNTALIIVGVVAVGVLVYVLAKKGGDDKTDESEDPDESSRIPRGSKTLAAAADIPAGLPVMVPASDTPRLNYYLAMENRTLEFDRELPETGLSCVTLEVGLSFGF